MINTYHSSFNLPPVPPPVPAMVPPPVPPRALSQASSRTFYRGETVLGTNTPLVKFLSCMVLLLMVMMFGGFLYLFNHLKKIPDDKPMTPQMLNQNKDPMYFGHKIDSSNVPLARMTSKLSGSFSDKNLTLLWDETHSLIRNIGYSSRSGELSIDKPGYYFIYSQVTFSKAHIKEPLRQIVWTRKSKKEEEILMMSYCSLLQPNALCTASQTGIFRLEEGQKILVNVTQIKLVNLDSTSFGLLKLQD